jgi:hypothetical protein
VSSSSPRCCAVRAALDDLGAEAWLGMVLLAAMFVLGFICGAIAI